MLRRQHKVRRLTRLEEVVQVGARVVRARPAVAAVLERLELLAVEGLVNAQLAAVRRVQRAVACTARWVARVERIDAERHAAIDALEIADSCVHAASKRASEVSYEVRAWCSLDVGVATGAHTQQVPRQLVRQYRRQERHQVHQIVLGLADTATCQTLAPRQQRPHTSRQRRSDSSRRRVPIASPSNGSEVKYSRDSRRRPWSKPPCTTAYMACLLAFWLQQASR